MPETTPTATAYEKRIRDFAAEKGVEMSRSKAQRLALRLVKRITAGFEVDVEQYVLDYWDETGETAVANVMDPRPVAPSYRVLDVTDWTPEQINDLHCEDELTDEQYAADLAAWEERNAARNGVAA